MIFETVCNLLAQITGCEESRIAMKTIILEDLEASSDDLHELFLALEEEFDVIWDEEFSSPRVTVADLVHHIEETI